MEKESLKHKNLFFSEEENTLNWVKASFNKQGYWEYRLKDIKFYK